MPDNDIKIRIMDAICSADGPSSKKSIREATGFAWNTVGRIVDGLVAERILLVKQEGPVQPGRPITLLDLNPENKLLVGLALGGNWWRLIICDYSFHTLYENKISTPKWSGESNFFKFLDDLIISSLKEAGIPLKRIFCFGVASSGNIEPDSGVLISALTMGVKPGVRLPVQEKLAQRFRKPVLVSISTVACAWAEHKFGEFAGMMNLISVGISIGIRAGIIMDGRPLIGGTDHPVGTIGHVYIPGNKRLCVCGRKGCLEAFAGGRSLVRVAEERYPGVGWNNAAEMDRAALNGDIRAANILNRAAKLDASCVAFLVQMYRPQALIFTGGQCAEGSFFYGELLKKIHHFLPDDIVKSLQISISSIKEYGNALGAARLAFEKYF